MSSQNPFNDWQDWGTPPVIGSTLVEGEVESTDPETIFRLNSSALTDAFLLISGIDFNEGAAFYELRSGYIEPDSFKAIGRTGFVLVDGFSAIVPFSNIGPEAQLFLEAFTGTPWFTTYTLITRDGPVDRTAITGYSPAIIEERVVADSGFELFHMQPMIAARHQLHVVTDCPDYEVFLQVAADEETFPRIPIASNTNPTGSGIEIVTPIGYWAIRIVNSDAVAEDFLVSLITKP